jgi:hypothetical protein
MRGAIPPHTHTHTHTHTSSWHGPHLSTLTPWCRVFKYADNCIFIMKCYCEIWYEVLFELNLNDWVTGWTIGILGFESQQGLGNFPFTTVSRTALGPTQPPIQWVPGALSLGVKRPGRRADHSPPSIAEVKNACSYTSTPQYVFMAWCLVKHRDNFTFTGRIPS